jgi:HK97 family phage major capsid protein
MSLKFQDLQEKLRKRGTLHRKITDKIVEVRDENGNISAEDLTVIERMQDELEVFDKEVQVLNRQLETDDNFKDAEERMRLDGLSVDHGDAEERIKKAQAEYRGVFAKWLRSGFQEMDQRERGIMINGATLELTDNEKRSLTSELRALSVGSDALGGYTVPDEMYNAIEKARLEYGGIFRSRVFRLQTANGRTMFLPTANDTGNTGELLGEAVAAADDEDPAFGQKQLDAYMFSSKIVKISVQLLEDSIANMEQLIGGMLGERIGRAQSAYYTTGTGSSQPQGIVGAAAAGITGSAAAAIAYADFINLKHSVDVSYRENAEFMFADSTLKAAKLLVDGDSRPLWKAGMAVREPDTIDGDRYVVNNSMAAIGASAVSVLYGDMSKFWIRDVKGVNVIRFGEKYMNALQIGLLAVMRGDSEILNAGTNPIKKLTHPAS